jgi:hypothetical protein
VEEELIPTEIETICYIFSKRLLVPVSFSVEVADPVPVEEDDSVPEEAEGTASVEDEDSFPVEAEGVSPVEEDDSVADPEPVELESGSEEVSVLDKLISMLVEDPVIKVVVTLTFTTSVIWGRSVLIVIDTDFSAAVPVISDKGDTVDIADPVTEEESSILAEVKLDSPWSAVELGAAPEEAPAVDEVTLDSPWMSVELAPPPEYPPVADATLDDP